MPGEITGMLNKITKEIVNKTQDTKNVIKMRSKINRAKDDIDEAYKEIGRLYYEQCAQSENELFAELVNRIDDCHTEMQSLKKQINQLQDIKLCESCEKAVKQDMKYCPYCGILLNDEKVDHGQNCSRAELAVQ